MAVGIFRNAMICVVIGALVVWPLETAEAKVRTSVGKGVNGGVSCATCAVIVALVEETSEVHNETVASALERLCSYLPDQPATFQKYCRRFILAVGPLLIRLVAEDASPDRTCHALGLCTTDPGRQTCRSIPDPPFLSTTFEERVKQGRATVAKYGHGMWHEGVNICDLPGIKEICEYIDNIFDNHFPAVDADQDSFSTFPTLRGAAWRGKDCDDFSAGTHPGARPVNNDRVSDSNCNGIVGVNEETGVAYEEELCGGSEPRGIAVLGDSISAHFHLPEAWFDATKISEAIFEHLAFILENEIDWPEMSTVTALGFNNWTEVIDGPIDSVYLRLRNRNRCNHKDYQNIAVNGADSSSMVSRIMDSLARDQEKDQPMVVIYALVGNDVCNGHVDDTFAHMTTPKEMRTNVEKTLQYLDTKLPANSTVFLVGLADGRVLYDSLKDRIHPIGRYWKTFTYAQFYDYFNCLQVTPCCGWMNTNETVRNMTAERAFALSAVLEDMAKQNRSSYTHFQLFYMGNPINQAIKLWTAKGGQTWQLLEPVDGFHSNQYGQALTAEAMWTEAERLAPGVFGPPNPRNPDISRLFGDQGAYF
ncbi:acyloxyacyl hydrolase-like [Babylonia areolata]|uniref:acyloxyacyl hydrolase-like n=1 Tax=Babylonia areolata TaxID=304850 RepID=UPI003FD3BE55